MSSSVISTTSSRSSRKLRPSTRDGLNHAMSSTRRRSRSRSNSLLDMDHLISGIRELDQHVTTSHGRLEKLDTLPNLLLDTTVSTTTTTTTSSTNSNNSRTVDNRYPRSSSKGIIQMNPQQEAIWKKKSIQPKSVSSNKSVQSSASTAEIREKEIARTVLRMAMKEKNPVLSDKEDSSSKSKYTSGVILGDLIRYETDDARSVVSALSLSSRRSTSRSRSKSQDRQRSNSIVSSKSHGFLSSQRSCTSDGVMDGMATDEADRLYNEFMKHLSPRPDLARRMNRARSETAELEQRIKKATPSLNKVTLGRSSSVPTTLKTVLPQVDGLEHFQEFDPFGLMEEKKVKPDTSLFCNKNTRPIERDPSWGMAVEGQNVRRYEFTFSEPDKSNTIGVRNKKRTVRNGVNFNRSLSNRRNSHSVESSQMTDFKQKVTAEEIHPDSLDHTFDMSEKPLSRNLGITTFVNPRKTVSTEMKKNTWEGFARSEKFTSVPFHGEDLS